MITTFPLPQSFTARKSKIVSSLSISPEDYDDLSPKGSIDVGIRDLIDEINGEPGWVTTSSCAGRVSVFLEGVKKCTSGGDDSAVAEESLADDAAAREAVANLAATGGKGGGGRWLFVSHDPIDLSTISSQQSAIIPFLGLDEGGPVIANSEQSLGEQRLIHFKFEPLILHILTASPLHAQTLLTAALGAGFRESGALNLLSSPNTPSSTPIVAIRSMGLSLETLIGRHNVLTGKNICFAPEDLLSGLLKIGNDRFKENTKRIERLRVLLKEGLKKLGEQGEERRNEDGEVWEDTGARRERKREEGLRKAKELKEARDKSQSVDDSIDAGVIDDLED